MRIFRDYLRLEVFFAAFRLVVFFADFFAIFFFAMEFCELKINYSFFKSIQIIFFDSRTLLYKKIIYIDSAHYVLSCKKYNT